MSFYHQMPHQITNYTSEVQRQKKLLTRALGKGRNRTQVKPKSAEKIPLQTYDNGIQRPLLKHSDHVATCTASIPYQPQCESKLLQFPIQVPAISVGKAVEDSWAPATHLGGPNGIAASWLQSGPLDFAPLED